MAAPKTGTTVNTTATLATSQVLNPTWRIEMSFGGVFRNRSWTDITTLVRDFSFVRGRSDELSEYSTCTMTVTLDNRLGTFTPDFSPLVTPGRPIRILCEYAGTRYDMCFGYVDEWRVEYPVHGKDAVAIADCSGIFSFLTNARSDTYLDAQYTTDRIVQMTSEVGSVEVDIRTPGTIAMPDFELYETEVASVVKSAAMTEFGQLFENKTGGIRFDGRAARFQQITPKIVFGDDLTIETGYEEAYWDYSQNKIFNRVTVTADPNDPQTVIDTDSASLYGVKQFSMDIDAQNSLVDTSYNVTYAESLANFILGRYAEPALRIESIGLHPAGKNKSVWDELLALELNDRVVVNRRPPGYTKELTTSTSRVTRFGTANAMDTSNNDPYARNYALRTTTDGRVTSSAWDTQVGVNKYEIVGSRGSEYLAVSTIFTSASGTDTSNRGLSITHMPYIPVTGGLYYTLTAYIYGATATMSTSAGPQVFRMTVDFNEFNEKKVSTNAPVTASSVNTTTVPYTVVSIPEQRVSVTRLLKATTAYIRPYMYLEYSGVAIPESTTVEFRCGEFALHGPMSSANFNGTTALSDGHHYRAYSTNDPNYVAPTDIYNTMSITVPSIGETIRRECFVEQIRYDVSPSNADWRVTLGLSDAITGGFWTLDQSRLGIDTRLAI